MMQGKHMLGQQPHCNAGTNVVYFHHPGTSQRRRVSYYE